MGNGGGWDRERLYLPLLDPFSYRDRCPGSLSPSPASSPSSRGWLSPASSCDSLLVEEEELIEPTINFGLSPSSRPTSPGGKKRRNSPLASPCTSRRGSYSEDLQGCNLDGGDSISLSQAPPSSCELSIPQKTRKTSLEQVHAHINGLSIKQLKELFPKLVVPLFCFPVVYQGGGPGAGSRPWVPLPAARDLADQERASLTGHGLPLCAPCSSLGPDPSQRPQPSLQASMHSAMHNDTKYQNKKPQCDTPYWWCVNGSTTQTKNKQTGVALQKWFLCHSSKTRCFITNETLRFTLNVFSDEMFFQVKRPAASWLATAFPVWPVWASYWGAAPSTPQSPLWDRGEQRSRQGCTNRTPCCQGEPENCFTFYLHAFIMRLSRNFVFTILKPILGTRVGAHCHWPPHSLSPSLTLCLSVQLCGYTERKPLSLQVFVGTADDRSIRPHPFYQIHR